MARFIRKSKHEIGISPDDLLFRGEKKSDKVILSIIDFDSENMEEKVISSVDEAMQYQTRDTVTWFNIDGIHDDKVMDDISKRFELDKLILADVMNTQVRPVMTEYPNCIFIALKMLQHDEKTGEINSEHLSIILTKSCLLTFQEREGDVFEPVRNRIRQQRKRIRSSGIDYLTFALIDTVIDNYIYILSLLGEKIDVLGENLIDNPKKQHIDEINNYKKELNFLRKSINPATEMILALSKTESELISDSTEIHFKELLENIKLATEASDSYREILSDQLNIYHTILSSKLNDIMKFLTVFSVIFIPLTFIAGIYGTNFDFLPELHYKYSYFIMLGVMLVLALGMLRYFKKKKWL